MGAVKIPEYRCKQSRYPHAPVLPCSQELCTRRTGVASSNFSTDWELSSGCEYANDDDDDDDGTYRTSDGLLRLGACTSATWTATLPDEIVGLCVESYADEDSGRDTSDSMQVLVNGEGVVTVYNDVGYSECIDLDSASGTPLNLMVVATSSTTTDHLHMVMDSLSLVYCTGRL